MKKEVSIIGAGSWGTTLAVILSRKGVNVQLHSVFREHNLKMQRMRENRLFLKGVKFPTHLKINQSLKSTLENEIIVIAIPVKFVRGILRKIKRSNPSFENKSSPCAQRLGKIFLSVSKGIEVKTLKRVSQIIEEELGTVFVAVLSGPNIAKEVLAGVPTVSVIACKDKRIARKLQILFSTPTFRVYFHQDIIGVELGGALKNIIALACGISDGLGLGTNTKAALVTRGLVEIIRLGVKMGANPQTFWGISGLGDLTTTCFSPYSRNRFVGEGIGEGKKLSDILKKMGMVAEGIETIKAAFCLSEKLGVDMPITREIYRVLYKNKSPKKAVGDLMGRSLKGEI
ncbi:MAG: NAD(P)-dependent glycerol-3-phosphate dehydrogenase [Candidatus Omnitrophica bacterium]|nr:NAD(P)-dependent glycerol-3-phosphate dehydrogenase [Candidatus Omnitrophota bacterium]